MAKSSNKGSAEERLNLLQSKKQAAITAGNTEEARKYQKAIEAVTKAIEKQNLELEASLNNITDLSDSVKSLGAFVGKNNKLFETMNSLTDSMSTSLDSISQQMTKLGPEAGKFKKETYKTAEAYKNLGNVIAVNTKKLKKQQTTTSQYNQSVLDSYDDLEEAIDRLDGQMEGLTGTSLKAAEAIKRTLEGQKSTLESFAKAAERSEKAMQATGFAFEQASAAGIPAANELGNIVKTMQEGGKGLTLSFAALGAVLGKMAYDLGFIGDKIGTIAKYDILIGDLTTKIDIFNDKLRLGLAGGGGGKNFVAARAINDFNNQIANMAMEFQAASKTALFGKSLGGVGYGAAQLQMAGISAETIASAMKDASSAMGSNVNGKFGADMAILAARTGQTSEGIASINDTFMRLGGVSKETAINMQEGLRTMADQANINLGSLMEDVAEASKDALSYQLKSPAALAKAATFAQTLGTKFTDIANAGKSMVLNYKDSIKAEMSLSAMLGKRVDLSQVRALFAAGKTEDAIKALKAQGLDPSKMNMFQQEALKNATGGMDLNTLQKIATRTGRSGGELGKGDVTGENQVFLSTKSSAESAKAVGSAVKAAMTEIQNKELENQYNKAKNKALINNTDGIADLTAQLKKLEAEKGIMTGGLAYMLGGALIGGGLGAGIGKLFKGGGTGAAATATGAGTTSSAAGSSMVGMFDKNGKPLTQSQINMKLTKGGTVPIGGTNTPMTASPSGNVSKLTKMGKGMGGVVSVLAAAYDYKTRKDQGQSTLQAASGAGGGATGALAGAALGSAIVPVIGTIIGGAIGYWAGSSLADELTGANEPSVKVQETIQTELNESQIAQSVKDGQLLSDSAYTIELQKEMVAQLGLSTTLLYEIADYNARGLFQSVNIDGKKVMDALASTSRKQFGVARNTMSSTTVR